MTILVLTLVILKYTNALTLEKSPTPAINAVSQANTPTAFRSMWLKGREKNTLSKNGVFALHDISSMQLSSDMFFYFVIIK